MSEAAAKVIQAIQNWPGCKDGDCIDGCAMHDKGQKPANAICHRFAEHVASAAYQAGYEAARPKAGKAQPITAWAVVDKDGALASHLIYRLTSEDYAKHYADFLDRVEAEKHRAPHRIARVRIEEIEGEK